MAQTIYAPIQTASLSEIAAAPFRERERQVMSRIANAEKATEQTGIYDVNISGLAPNLQAIAQPWIESIKKNMTEGFYANDTQRVNVARRNAQELQTFLESGRLATRAANESMIDGEKNLWRGLSVSKEEAKELYFDQTQKPFNTQFDADGYPRVVLPDGGLVSPLGISNLSPQNYFLITPAAKFGKNMNSNNYIEQYSNLVVDVPNKAAVVDFATERFNEDLKTGEITAEDIVLAGMLRNKYKGMTPEQLGQSRIIEEMNVIVDDPELFEKYKQEYLNLGVIPYATQMWESNQAAALARRDKSTTEKAPKFEQRTTTIDLGDGNFSKATQYTLTSPLKIGAKTLYNVYQTPAGEWYGFSATNKRRGSKSFVEEELIKLDSLESDYVVGQLGLKGAAGTTNRATRAASRM